MRDWRFHHIDFSTYPVYDGDDLGVYWSPEKTLIKIWAPTAKTIELRLYKDGKTGEAFYKTQLQKEGNGIWFTVLTGDYEGKFYTFRVNDGDWLHEVPDMYVRCVGINGKRGLIFNPAKTKPEGWDDDHGPGLYNPVDAVIYETHIRDFSVASNSGMLHKGKYLAFCEGDTISDKGQSTGLSHLTELGITHVHLLPVNDFYTVDEEKPDEKYNWGYDPLHYNVPEGSYSLNPSEGTSRIRELKMLVKSLHSAGIGVVLDVVYNHTYFAKESVFNQFVPGYFYRQKPDGTFANASGCGNEMATERHMVRKYIVDSLTYWMEEYHIDGFRFDLMGIYDLETMKAIGHALRSKNPHVILYGEGWAADLSPMPELQRAVKANLVQLDGIAAFNDDFRDALKGNHGLKKSKGFVSGLALREEGVKFGVVGAVHHPHIVYDYVETSRNPWAKEPSQCINYVSCHDNYTLWDKLKMSCPKASDELLRKMVKLAGALVLTSQGIPFLHSGIDFCRTKGGNGNSYNAPDSVNQIDWNRKFEYQDVFEYFKKLIRLRKDHPALRIRTSEAIRKNLHFCTQYQMGVVSYCIDGVSLGDSWEKVLLIFNANENDVVIPLPEGRFQVIDFENDHESSSEKDVSGQATARAVSMTLLATGS